MHFSLGIRFMFLIAGIGCFPLLGFLSYKIMNKKQSSISTKANPVAQRMGGNVAVDVQLMVSSIEDKRPHCKKKCKSKGMLS